MAAICHRCQQQNVAQQHEGTLATAGTPTTEETSTTVVTPGAEGIVTRAGPQQQQRSQ